MYTAPFSKVYGCLASMSVLRICTSSPPSEARMEAPRMRSFEASMTIFMRPAVSPRSKIVIDASNDRILGASILASEGGEDGSAQDAVVRSIDDDLHEAGGFSALMKI